MHGRDLPTVGRHITESFNGWRYKDVLQVLASNPTPYCKSASTIGIQGFKGHIVWGIAFTRALGSTHTFFLRPQRRSWSQKRLENTQAHGDGGPVDFWTTLRTGVAQQRLRNNMYGERRG